MELKKIRNEISKMGTYNYDGKLDINGSLIDKDELISRLEESRE